MTNLEVTAIPTPGLGDTSYVVRRGSTAVVIDPQRDIDRFIAGIDGARLAATFDTHVHNDYISGAKLLTEASGGDLVLPAASGVTYAFRPAFHLEAMDFGDLVVEPIHTPGHTPEHTSYLVIVEGTPVAVFTGGSMLVGSAGRTDLLGMDRAEQLGRLQYGSLHRLLELPDDVEVYPTHGGGSFCTSTIATSTSTTIGAERASNPVAGHETPESYVAQEIASLQPYPSYYPFMAPINVAGPEPIEKPSVSLLDDEQLAALDETIHIIDTRPRALVAAGHVPGSWTIELTEDFGTWAGWMVPFGEPIALILDSEDLIEEALVDLARIGYENIVGVKVGLDDWMSAGRPVATHRVMTAREFIEEDDGSFQVLDVRAPNEWDDMVLDDSIFIYVPDLKDGAPDGLDRSRPVYIGCTTGHRAGIAAAMLHREGYDPVVITGASLLGVVMLRQAAAVA